MLAAMLAKWRLAGWPREFGRVPAPEDLIVPHKKPTNRGPRVDFGGMRSDHDSYKRLRIDCDAVGLRHRRVRDPAAPALGARWTGRWTCPRKHSQMLKRWRRRESKRIGALTTNPMRNVTLPRKWPNALGNDDPAAFRLVPACNGRFRERVAA